VANRTIAGIHLSHQIRAARSEFRVIIDCRERCSKNSAIPVAK
jgi:hypothetical protein